MSGIGCGKMLIGLGSCLVISVKMNIIGTGYYTNGVFITKFGRVSV